MLLPLYSHLTTQAKHPQSIFARPPPKSPSFPQQVNQQNFQCKSLQTSLVLFPLSFLPDLILQTWPITAPRLTHAKCLLERIKKHKWDHFAPLQSTAYWKMSKLTEMPGGALHTPASSAAAPCLGCCRRTTYLHVSHLLSPHPVPHLSILLSLFHPLLLAYLQFILQNSNWMSLSPGNLP